MKEYDAADLSLEKESSGSILEGVKKKIGEVIEEIISIGELKKLWKKEQKNKKRKRKKKPRQIPNQHGYSIHDLDDL